MQEIMLSQKTRRKVAIHIQAANQKQQESSELASADSNGAVASDNAAQQVNSDNDVASEQQHNKDAQQINVQQIHDVWAFKRSQMLYPSSR